MRYTQKLLVSFSLFLVGVFGTAETAQAQECTEYTEAPSSESASSFTILDTDVGTVAYEKLLTYSKGGHKALGMAIASSYDYFGQCQYVGIGIMNGSGGNGFRPNFTLAIWRDGINLSTARTVIYQLIGADNNPVVTNGDCNISCDGTTGRQFDGTIINETTTSTTTTVPATIPQTVDEPVAPAEEPSAPTETSTPAENISAEPPAPAITENVTTTTVALTTMAAAVTAPTVKAVLQKNKLTVRKKVVKKPAIQRKR